MLFVILASDGLRWAGKPARDYLKSLPDSEFKYEGASADAILEVL